MSARFIATAEEGRAESLPTVKTDAHELMGYRGWGITQVHSADRGWLLRECRLAGGQLDPVRPFGSGSRRAATRSVDLCLREFKGLMAYNPD